MAKSPGMVVSPVTRWSFVVTPLWCGVLLCHEFHWTNRRAQEPITRGTDNLFEAIFSWFSRLILQPDSRSFTFFDLLAGNIFSKIPSRLTEYWYSLLCSWLLAETQKSLRQSSVSESMPECQGSVWWACSSLSSQMCVRLETIRVI